MGGAIDVKGKVGSNESANGLTEADAAAAEAKDNPSDDDDEDEIDEDDDNVVADAALAFLPRRGILVALEDEDDEDEDDDEVSVASASSWSNPPSFAAESSSPSASLPSSGREQLDSVATAGAADG